MQTRITARHFAASDGLRSHVARSLGKLERYFDRIHDAHVILHDAPPTDSRAEIALSAPRQTFSAAYAAPTVEAAVDGCVRQLRRQVVRHKDRLRRRKGAETARA
jgi:putative sigma-54 modulation protein